MSRGAPVCTPGDEVCGTLRACESLRVRGATGVLQPIYSVEEGSMQRVIAVVVSLMIARLALAGCSTETATTTPAPPTSVEAPTSTAPAAAPADGGTPGAAAKVRFALDWT